MPRLIRCGSDCETERTGLLGGGRQNLGLFLTAIDSSILIIILFLTGMNCSVSWKTLELIMFLNELVIDLYLYFINFHWSGHLKDRPVAVVIFPFCANDIPFPWDFLISCWEISVDKPRLHQNSIPGIEAGFLSHLLFCFIDLTACIGPPFR